MQANLDTPLSPVFSYVAPVTPAGIPQYFRHLSLSEAERLAGQPAESGWPAAVVSGKLLSVRVGRGLQLLKPPAESVSETAPVSSSAEPSSCPSAEEKAPVWSDEKRQTVWTAVQQTEIVRLLDDASKKVSEYLEQNKLLGDASQKDCSEENQKKFIDNYPIAKRLSDIVGEIEALQQTSGPPRTTTTETSLDGQIYKIEKSLRQTSELMTGAWKFLRESCGSRLDLGIGPNLGFNASLQRLGVPDEILKWFWDASDEQWTDKKISEILLSRGVPMEPKVNDEWSGFTVAKLVTQSPQDSFAGKWLAAAVALLGTGAAAVTGSTLAVIANIVRTATAVLVQRLKLSVSVTGGNDVQLWQNLWTSTQGFVANALAMEDIDTQSNPVIGQLVGNLFSEQLSLDGELGTQQYILTALRSLLNWWQGVDEPHLFIGLAMRKAQRKDSSYWGRGRSGTSERLTIVSSNLIQRLWTAVSGAAGLLFRLPGWASRGLLKNDYFWAGLIGVGMLWFFWPSVIALAPAVSQFFQTDWVGWKMAGLVASSLRNFLCIDPALSLAGLSAALLVYLEARRYPSVIKAVAPFLVYGLVPFLCTLSLPEQPERPLGSVEIRSTADPAPSQPTTEPREGPRPPATDVGQILKLPFIDDSGQTGSITLRSIPPGAGGGIAIEPLPLDPGEYVLSRLAALAFLLVSLKQKQTGMSSMCL